TRPRRRTVGSSPVDRCPGSWPGYTAGAGAVGTVDLASLLNRPEPSTSAPTQQSGVAVVSDRSLACPGPGLVGLADPEVEEPPQVVRAYAGSAPGGALPEGLEVAESGEVGLSGTQDGQTAAGTDRGRPVSVALAEGRWARAQASGGLAAGFAASQLSYSFAKQQWGLSTAVCGSAAEDRKSTRLSSSHVSISYAVFCLKKKSKHPGTPP